MERGRREERTGWASLFGGEFLSPVATAYLKTVTKSRLTHVSAATTFDILSDHFGKLSERLDEIARLNIADPFLYTSAIIAILLRRFTERTCKHYSISIYKRSRNVHELRSVLALLAAGCPGWGEKKTSSTSERNATLRNMQAFSDDTSARRLERRREEGGGMRIARGGD